MERTIEYKISGRRALFTDPVSKIGGEKFSYPVPTYQALKGITESIYWKPTIIWYIDSVRVIKPIRHESQNVRPLKYEKNENELSIYSYLSDVEYQVTAHFEWNFNREDHAQDRNENKHLSSALRYVKKGGLRDIFLGTRECQGYVEPCSFGEGEGAYDNSKDMPFGLMFHGFDYPDETGKDIFAARFWSAIMSNGIIRFPEPKDCTVRRIINENMKPRKIQTNTQEEF